jgi:hypothetical protein
MSNRSFVVNSIVNYTGDFSCGDAACGIGQLLVSGIFVETVIALISKKKPVSVLHNTRVLEDIGPLRRSSKSDRSLQTRREGDDLKLCE